MSKLMWIAGILLTAAGIALGLMVLVSTAPLSALNLETAAILLVGGILAIGLGGVVNAVEKRPAPPAETVYPAEAAAPVTAIPEFGRRSVEAAAPVAAAAAVVTAPAATAVMATESEVSEPTKETIQALEQARLKIEQAFDPKPAREEAPVPEEAAGPATPPVAEEEPPAEEALPDDEPAEGEEVLEEGQLYVIEERVIRNRPARILSDGTVEAETDEGWMRFENLEHLDEYLDAVAPARG